MFHGTCIFMKGLLNTFLECYIRLSDFVINIYITSLLIKSTGNLVGVNFIVLYEFSLFI